MYRSMTKKSHRRTRGAFTLLEILLVVGLLALLAAFVVPALSTQGEKAKKKIAEAAVGPNSPLSSNINLYKFDTGQFPEELKFLIEKPGDSEIAEKWGGPYIEDPKGFSDPWGHDYQYNPEGEHNPGRFDLWCLGPDGIDGNEDDITNWESDR